MTTRRGERRSPEQIVRKWRDADAMLNAGKDLAEVLQMFEVSEGTYLRWWNQYGGMKSEEARWLKILEEEPTPQKGRRRADLGQSDAEARGLGKQVSPSRKRSAVELCKSSSRSQNAVRVAC